MQIGQTQVVRNPWYDRAISIGDYSIRTSYPPHFSTARQSYIVPANRKAKVSILPSRLTRLTVATSVGTGAIYLTLTPSGGGIKVLYELDLTDNTLYAETKLPPPPHIILNAGDKLALVTLDTSTDGLYKFSGGFLVNEYNA